MAKRKPNTNFKLGLNREQLIETAGRYGKTASKAKKASTKTLENFVLRQIVGKNSKLPTLTPQDIEDVKSNSDEWGLGEGLKRLTYRASKLAGNRNEQSFLRLTLSENFSLFRDNKPTSEHIDELISRLPRLNETQVDSDMVAISPYYRQLFLDYSRELDEEEKQEQEEAEAEAQAQFNEQNDSQTSSRRRRNSKSKSSKGKSKKKK